MVGHRESGAENTTPAIWVEDVSKSFTARAGAQVTAVKGMSFTVEQGEFVSLVGRSGCGKSTVLRLICGLLQADEGTVVVDGRQVKASARDDVGFMMQKPVLLPWRTVWQNVMLPAEIMRLPKREYEERARYLLSLVGLAGRESAFPKELSGGMQQRASLVRLLAREPRILVMDEPFAALDAITREELGDELLRLFGSSSHSTVFVTHDVEEAVYLSDRIIIMGDGVVKGIVDVPLGSPREPAVRVQAGFADCCTKVRAALTARI